MLCRSKWKIVHNVLFDKIMEIGRNAIADLHYSPANLHIGRDDIHLQSNVKLLLCSVVSRVQYVDMKKTKAC